MAVEHLKSASITNLDTIPVVPNTTGEGGPGYERNVSDASTPTAANLVANSTYQMVRVPSNAKIKRGQLVADAALDTNGVPTLAVNIGLNYSDSTVDGTAQANQGGVINASLFAAAVSFGRATSLSIDAIQGFSVLKRNQPLWQAAGLTSDPGGFFDVVVTISTGAATGVSQPFGLDLTFID